jgi:hypothetical protein
VTVTEDQARTEAPATTPPIAPAGTSTPPPPTTDTAAVHSDRPIGVGLTCAAVGFAGAAAGWMLGGVFDGALPRVLAIGAAVAGAGVVWASQRTTRPGIWQYLSLPFAIVIGALLVLPFATGGSANLPSLVKEAVQTGGLGQPPVPFEPGWRFLVVVLLMTLTTGAAALSTSLERPRLGVAVVVPVVIAAALVQPPSSAALNSAIALVLMVGALILGSGAQYVQEGASSTTFESKRLVRGAGALVLLAAVLIPLSQTGVLFPKKAGEHVIPPQRPHQQPPLSDRVLFSVDSAKDDLGPWRFGVLDVYNGVAWLLPPYDQRRFGEVKGAGDLAAAATLAKTTPADGPTGVPAPGGPTRSVTITVGDLPGRVLPTVDGARLATNRSLSMQFDPRTQTFRSTGGRAVKDSHYTISAIAPPDSSVLMKSPKSDPKLLAPYLQVPPMPDAVTELLAKAPSDNMFRRLQYVRAQFYSHVIASGQGKPVDVSPDRVVAMLNGAHASPYEIVAGEALLARWAGVPSRVGYGFYAGNRNQANTRFQVHPHDGATWLEAYFPGPGWVSIIGKPPRAEASTNLAHKRQEQSIQPAGLSVIVHVPIELQDLHQLYETMRYWALVSLPWIVLLVLLAVFYPAGFKAVRRMRRRRWAARHGPAATIVAAYAELRDRLRDVNAPEPTATPLEFCSAVAYDDEHWELAWLVTRGLYGDLRRDLRPEDAAAAVDMAQSVAVRALRAQRVVVRVLGQANRTSLRDPWTRDVPNAWPTGDRWRRLRARLRRLRRLPRLRPARLAGATPLLLALLVLLTGCGSVAVTPPPLPSKLVPAAVGSYVIQREPLAEQAFTDAGKAALVTDGHVYTVHHGGDVLGSIQLAQFLPKVGNDRRRIERSLRAGIGSGDFHLQRVGTFPVYSLREDQGRVLLYFPPGGGYYVMLEARDGFDDADRFFAAVIGYERGVTVVTNDTLTDPRRGGD